MGKEKIMRGKNENGRGGEDRRRRLVDRAEGEVR